MLGRTGYGPGPAHPDAYEYVLGLHKSLIAWEFLRRCSTYQDAYRSHASPYDSVSEPKGPNRFVRIARKRHPFAGPFGLRSFVEPGLSGAVAPIFWLRDYYSAVLRMRVAEADRSEVIKAPIRIASLPCRIWALIEHDGAQHLLLTEHLRAIQFTCTGPLALEPDVNLVVEIDDFADVRMTMKTLGELEDFFQGFLVEKAPDQTEAKTLRWQQMLMVYDGKQRGMTDRDVAEALFGEADVAAEWQTRDGPLRARTRRLVTDAQKLVDGGYQRILRGA